eukprot:397934-Pleurochrysis_carterae.AAC.1
MADAAAVLSACGVDASQFAVGKSRVFLRAGVLAELERQRLEVVGFKASVAQAAARGLLARRWAKRILEERR